jgi:hypothetical protein
VASFTVHFQRRYQNIIIIFTILKNKYQVLFITKNKVEVVEHNILQSGCP